MTFLSYPIKKIISIFKLLCNVGELIFKIKNNRKYICFLILTSELFISEYLHCKGDYTADEYKTILSVHTQTHYLNHLTHEYYSF